MSSTFTQPLLPQSRNTTHHHHHHHHHHQQYKKWFSMSSPSSRRRNLIGLCLVSLLCILLLFTTTNSSSNSSAATGLARPHYITPDQYSHRFGNRFNQVADPASPDWPAKKLQLLADLNGNHLDRSGSNTNNNHQLPRMGPLKRIAEVLSEQREILDAELIGFPFPEQKALADFTPATGGQPRRSIVITTWRSGSTFLGDILNALPGNFYHYEPLLDFGTVQVRDEPLASKAIGNLKNLLNCDYQPMREYLDFGEEHVYLLQHNTRLWNQCQDHPHLCWRPRFLSPFCKLFPLQSMKVVRLRLAIAERLLEDKSLNAHIIYLVRDPRGTLQSRKHRDWCPGTPDCDHAATLCQDLVSDHKAAQELLQKYPDQLKIVRYEDLSLEPFEGTKDILNFYGLPFVKDVEMFLESHTKINYGGVSSTFRDSKSAPFHWIKDLQFGEIQVIQESCTKAMSLWGYRPIANESMLDMKFNPLLPYTV